MPSKETPILLCDRCGATEPYTAERVDDAYIVDDPARATGALCPNCATDDDQHHTAGSWLLMWEA